MEPVTHLFTGACLARTGFHRRVAYATVAMATAAEFPDIDTLWSLRGPVSGFEHHRGITHTFLGLPFEAGLLLLCVFAWDRWRRRKLAGRAEPRRQMDGAVVRWGALYALILLALLSHLLLDYTNNYGLRPFFPFNDHWYAASIVFIFDPLLFAFLVAGLVLPSLFRLISGEIGAGDQRGSGAGWARAALASVLLLWGVRTYEHGRAIALGEQSTLRAPATEDAGEVPSPEPSTSLDSSTGSVGKLTLAPAQVRPLLQPLQTLASPDPLSIFRWYTATDFGPVEQLGLADCRLGTLVPDRMLVKPAPTPALAAGERSRLGRIYLDWSPMPYLSVDHENEGAFGQGAQTVRFQDPRFMGDTPILHRDGQAPLTGIVVLDAHGDVVAEGMDSRFGR